MSTENTTADFAKLAAYFSALIRAEYTAEELAEVQRRNATAAYAGACATHDFRDANAYMFGAWAALHFEAPRLSDDATVEAMNQAWEIARSKGFQP